MLRLRKITIRARRLTHLTRNKNRLIRSTTIRTSMLVLYYLTHRDSLPHNSLIINRRIIRNCTRTRLRHHQQQRADAWKRITYGNGVRPSCLCTRVLRLAGRAVCVPDPKNLKTLLIIRLPLRAILRISKMYRSNLHIINSRLDRGTTISNTERSRTTIMINILAGGVSASQKRMSIPNLTVRILSRTASRFLGVRGSLY